MILMTNNVNNIYSSDEIENIKMMDIVHTGYHKTELKLSFYVIDER